MVTTDNSGETYKPVTGLVYLFNLIVGTGALTMPAAFANAGWAGSTVVVVVLCLVSYITTTFVIETMSLANALIKYNQQKAVKRRAPTDRHCEGQSSSHYEASAALPPDKSYSHFASSYETLPLLDSEDTGDDQRFDRSSIGSGNDDMVVAYKPKEQELRERVVNGDPSDEDMDEEDNYFAITRKVELGAMADMFFGAIGVKLFYVTIAIYLYGDLAIYAAAISKSLRDVTCSYEPKNCTASLSLSDQCWTGMESISRQNAYRIYLAVTLLCIGPFAFFNVQKTKYLQMLTTLLRWIAFISMTIIAIIALSSGKARARPSSLSISGVPNLFGVCVYSFMCHHSLPSLVTPINDKRRIFSLILTDYLLILGFYCLLSFTGIFAFSHLEDIYTLNFQIEKCVQPSADNPIKPVPFLDYFLPLFPVFTLSTSFPIIAITLQNNLKTLFQACGRRSASGQPTSFIHRRLFYPLVAIIPPLIIAFATEDLEILVGVVGSYAGAAIQYIFPALLVYYSRKKFVATTSAGFGAGMTRIVSPFSHRLWILMVLLWSVICIALVTTNHIIQFTKK